MLIAEGYSWLYSYVIAFAINRDYVPVAVTSRSGDITNLLAAFLISQKDTLTALLLPCLVSIAYLRQVNIVIDNLMQTGTLTYHVIAIARDMLQIEDTAWVVSDVIPYRASDHGTTIGTGRREIHTTAGIVAKRHPSIRATILNTIITRTTQLGVGTKH